MLDNELLIPNHIGIIMDGNGRWAKERGMIRTMGHKKAVGTLKELCIHMADVGVRYCSLYAFSTENFKRDIKEVEFLMNLFISSFEKEFEDIKKRKVRVLFSGRREPLPEKVLKAMDKIVEDTQDNKELTLNICLNYGSHAEIVDMTKKISELYKDNKISLDDINEELISKNLYQDLPPLDFVIRTSGELRLSNFMMWQAAYSELYFPDTLWPDFNKKELYKALKEFEKRNRRFGSIKEEG